MNVKKMIAILKKELVVDKIEYVNEANYHNFYVFVNSIVSTNISNLVKKHDLFCWSMFHHDNNIKVCLAFKK